MKTGKRTARFRTGTLLLALLVLLSVCLSAQAEQLNDPTDVTMLLAENAVETFGLTDPDGNPLKPRQASEMKGRGDPDVTGVEPDYRGVVGYVSLQTDFRVIGRFNTFTNMPWVLPVYRRDGDDFTEVDRIRHKTPVLVTDQVIREGLGHKYMGYLSVIRLDTLEQAWIDVINFATVPYWRLPLDAAPCRTAPACSCASAIHRDASVRTGNGIRCWGSCSAARWRVSPSTGRSCSSARTI